MSKQRLFANLYICDRAYGGPEEGGWWYDTGTPVDAEGTAIYSAGQNEQRAVSIDLGKHAISNWAYNNQDAENRDGRIQALEHKLTKAFQTRGFRLDGLDESERSISSVICSGVITLVIEPRRPKPWPETRTYYE